MAVPTFASSGAQAAGATGISVAYPATVNVNDIAIIVLETANQPITDTTIGAGDWVEITRAGTGAGGGLSDIGVQAFWRRCDGTEDGTTVSVPDAGDHVDARMFTVAGCVTSGSPVHQTSANAAAVASTSYSANGSTTTLADVLVVVVMGRSNDSGSTLAFGAPSNADLAGLSERFEVGSTAGNGGGFVVTTGDKATAGSVGATTATGPSATQANIAFGLTATAAAGSVEQLATSASFSFAGSAALTRRRSVLAAASFGFGSVTPLDGGCQLWTAGSWSFGGEGQLVRIRGLRGAGAFAFASAPHLVAVRALGATGAVTFAGAAHLTARRALSSAGAFVFGSVASIDGNPYLSGAASWTWTAAAPLGRIRTAVVSAPLAFDALANLTRRRAVSTGDALGFAGQAVAGVDRGLRAAAPWSWSSVATLAAGRLTRQLRVLLALKALVQSALPGATVQGFDGDADLPRRLADGGNIVGWPAEPGEPETEFSPRAYVFRQRVHIGVAAGDGIGGEALDAMLLAIGAAVEADRTLGGLCEWVEASAAERSDRTPEGIRSVNWATVPVIAEYRVENPLGV